MSAPFLKDTIDPASIPDTVDPNVGSGVGSSAAAAPSAGPGTLVGGYLIERPLRTSGIQAKTYLASRGENTVVIKIYHEGFRPIDGVLDFASSDASPHLARLLAHGRFENDRYFYEVFPHFPDGTLADALARGKASEMLASSVVLPALDDALFAMQSEGLIHADVKPENIFVDRSGGSPTVVLGDFGTATTFCDANEQGAFRGTVSYAPRQRIVNGGYVYSKGYDYGSLGLVLWKTCLGTMPLEDVPLSSRNEIWNELAFPPELPLTISTLIAGLIRDEGGCEYGHDLCLRFFSQRFRRDNSDAVRHAAFPSAALHKKSSPILDLGIVGGRPKVVSSLEELLPVLEENQEVARRIVGSPCLREFFGGIDTSGLGMRVIKDGRRRAVDDQVFLLCAALRTILYKEMAADDSAAARERDRICYKGERFANVVELLDAIRAGVNTSLDTFVESDLLPAYLEVTDRGEASVKEARRVLGGAGEPTVLADKLLALFAPSRISSLEINGRRIESLDELLNEITGMSIGEVQSVMRLEALVPFLHRIGCSDVLEEVVLSSE